MSVYDVLVHRLSVILEIPVDTIYSKDFFKKECFLSQYILDNRPDLPSNIDKNDYEYQHWTGTCPYVQETCECLTRIRYNFICVHKASNTPFILGSHCICLLNPDAFKKKCLDKNCTKLVKTGYCKTHKRKCICGKIHRDNHICYCYQCNKKSIIKHGSNLCDRCAFDKYYY